MSESASTFSFSGSTPSLFTPEEVEQLMRIEFERAQRYKYAVSCLVIEVDRLDQLHTVHGFEAKGEVIGRVVELVREATRAGDLLGYQVEDRLLCVFPHTGAKAVRGLCDRLLRSARDLTFQVGHASLRVTLSVGLAHNEHTSDIAFETLKKVAMEGLSVATAAGGDRWAETELYGLMQSSIEEEPVPDIATAFNAPENYRKTLERMVAEDGDLERAVADLAEQMLQRATAEAREELQTPEPASPPGGEGSDEADQYKREIELLRRRVSKLTESLGLTEAELSRLRSMKSVDDGLSSIYREVQGLSMEDARTELKKELMSSIFEANLDLQSKQKEAG